jgi:hypothetical protein
MTSQEQLRDISGAIAYDRAGNKLGKIGQVCYDDDTDLAASRRGGLAVLAPAMSAQSFLTWDSVDGADWRVAPSSRAPEGARNA